MAQDIKISIGGKSFAAELNDSKTARAIWEALPLKCRGSYWGKEIYFTIPVDLGEEDPQSVVEPGTLAYWPVGKAFCIFWGATPASRGDECRPYSPVNVFGRITGALDALDSLDDPTVIVDKVER
jgi:hypothetical protein